MPGPKSVSAWSGNDGSTWFQLLTVEPGPQMAASCSTVRSVAQSFSGLTTIVRASLAIPNSSKVIPSVSQAATSSSSIAREALEMSVSPAQNFSNPPPVPDVPTVTLTPGFSAWKSSAATVVSGATVLDPSMTTSPESSSLEPESASSFSGSLPPQAASARARVATPAAATDRRRLPGVLRRRDRHLQRVSCHQGRRSRGV